MEIKWEKYKRRLWFSRQFYAAVCDGKPTVAQSWANVVYVGLRAMSITIEAMLNGWGWEPQGGGGGGSYRVLTILT